MNPREMLDKETLCVEEHAPFCAAECPVHFDARSMNMLIEKNDFRGAYALYKSAVMFPDAVSEECPAPCEKKCKRGEAGDGIAIKELERAVIRLGKHKIAFNKSEIKIQKKVAVIYGGLDSLAAACSLLLKGYSPDLFTPEQEMPVIGNDFDFLSDEDVIIHTGQKLDKESIETLTENFDAVYLGNYAAEEFLESFAGAQENPKHFFSVNTNSVIEKISHGKTTALTIDRFLKGVSLTAGRKNEGSYETRLFTSTAGIEARGQTPKTGVVYSSEEAVSEARRCMKCRCMECVKECVFMEKYEKYPRKYIREVFNNISTAGTGFRPGKPMINSCTLCGLCGEICPNQIPMANIYLSARESLVKGGLMPPRYHDFPLRDMLFSNSDAFSFFRPPRGKDTGGYMFFPGCQLAAANPGYIKPMYEYLSNALNGEAGLMLGCCGAPALWAGRGDVYGEVMDRFREIWKKAGSPEIITACPTCHREFSEALPEAKIQTVWHYYSANELPETEVSKTRTDTPVSVHDPCTSRYMNEMHADVRNILRRKGYVIEELEYSGNMTRCCGYGGLAGYIDPALAREFADKRISEARGALVTYCSVCRDFIADGKKPVYHILDIIYGNADSENGLRGKPGISEKVRIRTELKKSLLRDIWGEEYFEPVKALDSVSLIINAEVREKLEKRFILEDNVKEVVYDAERTGGKIVNPKSGHFIAYKAIGTVTYWVEYEKTGELFYIHSAYSHRIKIMEGKDADGVSRKRY